MSKQLSFPLRSLGFFVSLFLASVGAVNAALISNVVETGGDNEATDTVPAKWTGNTFSNGIAGEFQNPFTVPPFREDAPAYVDRTHQWNGATTALPIPSYLLGGEYIMIGNDNRDNPDLILEVTLAEQAIVYLLIDNRMVDLDANTPPDFSAGMTWVVDEGWEPVLNGLNRRSDPTQPDEVGVDEAGDATGPGGSIQNWSSVYSKIFPAGTFTLRQADNPARNMYGVVVAHAPGSLTSPPEITNISPANNTLFAPSAPGLTFNATTAAGNRIERTNISVVLNGTDVSSSLTVGGTVTQRTVAHGSLVPNTLYLATIVVTDQAGRGTTNVVSFDTFNASSAIAIEAEDYNHSGGQFIANSDPAGYADQTGVAEKDYHVHNPITLTAVYRPADFTGLGVTTDVARRAFTDAGAPTII